MIKKNFMICEECNGNGKKKRRIQKKLKRKYEEELRLFVKDPKTFLHPVAPVAHAYTCEKCNGTGLQSTDETGITQKHNFPHVAIIGAGIGGVALAVSLLHRGIPFTIYERDNTFDDRAQGYGLTLQQASSAIKSFGLFTVKNSIISTRHIVFQPDGKKIGEWGMRKWLENDAKKTPSKTNIHIARQSLRLQLIQLLGSETNIKWGHQFINFSETSTDGILLNFKAGTAETMGKADLIVGADGIRSVVRQQVIPEIYSPLRYLGCMVILGICNLKDIENYAGDLLDSATVFQTANGVERIFVMPFNEESMMWQLSFPILESSAIQLHQSGCEALKNEAIKRVSWHEPLPQMLQATPAQSITGYPAYDRTILKKENFEKANNSTLLGDAAHPMSPFKGQGANQALLDALSLARKLYQNCRDGSNWQEVGLRALVLNTYEEEMIARTESKVVDSAKAADFLHSEMVLTEADHPRGSCLKP